MRGLSSRRTTYTLLLLAFALAAIWTTSASSAQSRGCSAVPYGAVLQPDSQTGRSALHSFDDHIEDVAGAPDICASNVVTNDNLGAITIGLHLHDRTRFSAGDGYSVFVDTDSNPATGSLAGTADPVGAEYEIELRPETSSLWRWNGTAFEPATPQAPLTTVWLEGYGPVVEINRKDLGDVQAFRFVFVTSNGTDLDLAPDFDMWSYALSPLTLRAGPLAIVPARAGRFFAVAMSVERSDFEIALDEGTIRCAARIGGSPLRGSGEFVDEHAACVWRIPRTASGKRLAGSISVTFQGVTAKRAFNVRVK